MPNRYRSLAHEAPLLRLGVTLPDGRSETVTISTSFRPNGDHADPQLYRTQLRDLVESFLSARGLKLHRLELVNSYTIEVGS